MTATASRERPQLSIVIPTFNRPDELQLCLEGFARQTASTELYEVIVVDDGSSIDMASPVAAVSDRITVHLDRRAHAGLAAAKNAGIERARGSLLILDDDDLRPTSELVEYCLDFHNQNPAEQDAALLYFGPDATIKDSPVVRWFFPRLYAFP